MLGPKQSGMTTLCFKQQAEHTKHESTCAISTRAAMLQVPLTCTIVGNQGERGAIKSTTLRPVVHAVPLVNSNTFSNQCPHPLDQVVQADQQQRPGNAPLILEHHQVIIYTLSESGNCPTGGCQAQHPRWERRASSCPATPGSGPGLPDPLGAPVGPPDSSSPGPVLRVAVLRNRRRYRRALGRSPRRSLDSDRRAALEREVLRKWDEVSWRKGRRFGGESGIRTQGGSRREVFSGTCGKVCRQLILC